MVDKSIDHEKLLPICFLQKHWPFLTSISVRVSRKEREKQIAPPSRHFSSTKTNQRMRNRSVIVKKDSRVFHYTYTVLQFFFILMRKARAVRTDSYPLERFINGIWTATVRQGQGEGTGGGGGVGGRTAYHTWQLFETEILTSTGFYITF